MKRVRCPKCDQYITFDETKYEAGQSLVFKCPDCGKEFGIRIGVSKLRETQKEENKTLNSQLSTQNAALSLLSKTYSITSRLSLFVWATTSLVVTRKAIPPIPLSRLSIPASISIIVPSPLVAIRKVDCATLSRTTTAIPAPLSTT